MKQLSRIIMMTHALNWLELVPGDPRRQTATWEQWPGRCEICHTFEFVLKNRYEALMGAPDDDAGVFVLESGMKGDPPLIALAQRTFGDRCVVCRFPNASAADCKSMGDAFVKSLDADIQRARQARGELAEGEITAWQRSKLWAEDLRLQFAARGYTFDPATVDFIVLGEDWCGCASTYPIHMGRALGLTKPMFRRFDLINPDCSKLLLGCTAVEQNIPLPGEVRLFILQTAQGRLVAQFWQALHTLWETPQAVTVSFPPGTARIVNVQGDPVGEPGGTLRLRAGCGGHTPWPADLVMAEAGVSYPEFRQALVAGKVREQ